jgi:ABC-2 type transport system ATP-binding protein
MLAIDAQDLAKTFRSGVIRRRETAALRGVSLAIPRGMIFGLLGPNGAGKTTLLSILSTLLVPDRGRATVLGHDLIREPTAIRRRLNMASGNASFLWSLRVEEIIAFYGRLYGLWGRALAGRVDELIDLCELTRHRRVPYNELSTGLKQRLALAKSLVNRPELLFLDEPTLGLDPDVSVRVRAQIATILLTTHYMREAEELCDEIAFIKDGRILARDTSAALARQIGLGDVIALRTDAEAVTVLGGEPGVLRAVAAGGWVELTVDSAGERLGEILHRLRDKGVAVCDVQVREPQLEDVFMELSR